MKLWEHQKRAIEVTTRGDGAWPWASGIHAHATGTGKSVLMLSLLRNCINANKYQPPLIYWICERKNILREQFDSNIVKKKGFHFRDCIVFRFDRDKRIPQSSIYESRIWGKPRIVIINRTYLTYSKRYRRHPKSDPITMVLHDECHTATNNSSVAFYKWLRLHSPRAVRLGFTATPAELKADYKDIYPQILTRYSMYNAIEQKHIVPPVIMYRQGNTDSYGWLKQFLNRPYRKAVVWCGMITEAQAVVKELKARLHSDYLVVLDVSNSDPEKYMNFYHRDTAAILVCAAKHREGSDIPNLDTCVFMDGVTNRSKATFVQCVGRVLRRDPCGIKQDGLIVDPCSPDALQVAERIHSFLGLTPGTCPWDFSVPGELRLKKNDTIRSNPVIHTIQDIFRSFVRPLHNTNKYKDRLRSELQLIHEKQLSGYLIRGKEILTLARRSSGNIPHVTRGSCGSSLVCYLMGISHVDPVRYRISFARFLNRYRDSMPDLDFDFPHFRRNSIFLRIIQRWPGQVARISNHLHWHARSAVREAIRRCGHVTPTSNQKLRSYISSLSLEERDEIDRVAKDLDDMFRGYSLHCGGILHFPKGIPSELLLEKKKHSLIPQIIWDKRDASTRKETKVDILSSRGLSQLWECCDFKSIDWGNEEAMKEIWEDSNTADLFASGDNIGITLAESPLMRQALVAHKPRSVEGIAYCLSVIRPAAYGGEFVYDDDVIEYLAPLLQQNEERADYYRRRIGKKKIALKELMAEIRKGGVDIKDQNDFESKFKKVGAYSFCKSHAVSYAMLVWYLGYMKSNYPKKFWKATLHHNHSSYRPWVHLVEAARHGVFLDDTQTTSIYSKARHRKQSTWDITLRLEKTGAWDTHSTSFYPGCYFSLNSTTGIAKCRGLVAATKSAWWFVGWAPGKYVYVEVNPRRKQFPKNTPMEFEGIWNPQKMMIEMTPMVATN